MKKFWQTDFIPKNMQKLIEDTLKNAQNIASTGNTPAKMPKDAAADFVEAIKDMQKEAIKKKEKIKAEKENSKDLASDISEKTEEKK